MLMNLIYTGQNQKIVIGTVFHNKIPAAIGAAAAMLFRRFAERAEDHLPQTLLGSAVPYHLIQLFQFIFPYFSTDGRIQSVIFGTVFDKETVDHNIFLFIKENTFRRFAVAAGAPRFLIVAFDIFRHIVMNDTVLRVAQ